MTYRLSGRARRDLLQIWNYIAEDNEPAADRFLDLLIRHFRLLGQNPSPVAGGMSWGLAIAASQSDNT